MNPAEAALERRYRRLLRCYPPAHRAVHEREMLDVLMTAAPNGQLWPELVEVASLLWGAFRLWLRGSGAGERSWRDVLAVFTVAGPLVLFAAMLIGGFVSNYHWATMPSNQYGMHHSADWRYQHALAFANWSTLAWLVSPASAGLPVLTLVAWMRLRRTAITVCVLAIALNAIALARSAAGWSAQLVFHSGPQPIYLQLIDPVQVLQTGIFIAELVALLASAGPRRGRELLGRRQLRCLALAGLAFGIWVTAAGLPPGTPSRPIVAAMLSGTVLLVVMLRRPLSTRIGRRLMLVFLLAAYPLSVYMVLQVGYSGLLPQPVTDWLAIAVPLAAIAGLVLSGLGGVRGVAGKMRRPTSPTAGPGPGSDGA